MAGTVSLSPGVRWSAASWLFDWVLRDVAKGTADVELAGHLNGIVGENLGWFGLEDITAGQRREAYRVITERLVDDANREFPADMPRRPDVLAHLKDLAAMVCDRTGGGGLAADRDFEEFEVALRQLGPRDQNLAAVVKDHLAAGQTREEALVALTRFRQLLASAGRDEDEDIVLEVMDYVVGWASQHLKL